MAIKWQSFVIDIANSFRYRSGAAQIMDNCAELGFTKEMTTNELAKQFAASRESTQMGNRILGAAFAILSGPVLALFGAWKFAESFDKIPFTDRDNPIKSDGLKPEMDYVRAQKIVNDHYGKRFDNGVPPMGGFGAPRF